MKKEEVVKLSILILLVLGIVFIGNIIGNSRNLKYAKSYGKIDKRRYAMYVKEAGGDYQKYDGDTWPKGFYKLNQELTYCTDLNGNKIDVDLSYANGKVSVSTNKTVYCTLYFEYYLTARMLTYDNNEEEYTECTDAQCAIDELYDYDTLKSGISNDLVAGLYRYQGVNPDNYICFGTTDKDICTTDTDKYMYRIIGQNENNQYKLIKKEALNTAYAWNTNVAVSANWANSTLYNGLNGSYFLTNTDYVPSGWEDRIANTTWKYGSFTNTNATIEEIATAELGFTNSVNAKIGLMYIHDYAYGLLNGYNCTADGLCELSWINLCQDQNDLGAPVCGFEWSMTHYAHILVYNQSWTLHSYASIVDSKAVSVEASIRPVFYLTASQNIASGGGTLTNPFILS